MAPPLSDAARVVRGVRVRTPLGDSAFLVRSFRFRERLGQPFEGVVDVIGADPNVDLGKLLGAAVTVSVPLPAGGTRYFSGICLEARQTGADGNAFAYRLVMVAWLRLLDLGSDCRIFQDKTVQSVLEEVFADLGFSDYDLSGIHGRLPMLDFCVQYDETHLNFVERLTQRFGIAYHATHTDGGHRIVFTDAASAHQPFPGYDTIRYAANTADVAGREHVFSWQAGRRMATGKVVLKDFDFAEPSSNLETADSADHGYAHGSLERFEYPGLFRKKSDGDSLARIRLGERTCGDRFFVGEARCYGLAAGSTFKLQGHPRHDQNASFLTTALDFSLEPADAAGEGRAAGAFACTCSFEAIPATVDYRPPRTARMPRIDGVQTAIVVGPSGQDPKVPYTDQYASVRVQFPWDRRGRDDEKSSCWLRHAQAFAGSGWGATFLPLVGCEVVVAFVGGDPDRPLVLGGVYNGEHKPPRELPAHAVKTVIQDVAGNFAVLDSQAGKESITVRTVNKNNWQMMGDCSEPD